MPESTSRKSKAVSIFLVALLVILTVTVSGCTKEAPGTVRIGAVYPLTGSLSTTGADVRNGVLLALDIVNNDYNLDLPLARSEGIDSLNGAKLEIVFGDSQGSPSVGRSETERLIDKEKVVADAINRTGSTDPEAIREALLETNVPGDKLIMPWDGIRFDRVTHQNTLGKGIICQIIEQEYCTVWPRNLATRELVWPMPKWEER